MILNIPHISVYWICFLIFFGLQSLLNSFHSASVCFDDHCFFHLTLPLAFLSHLCFVFLSCLLLLHQFLQGMLCSLHSELDIQRYLMKIQWHHRVSQPFLSYLHHAVAFASLLTSAVRPCSNPTRVSLCLLVPAQPEPAKHTWLPG